jgi:hypothetical protein
MPGSILNLNPFKSCLPGRSDLADRSDASVPAQAGGAADRGVPCTGVLRLLSGRRSTAAPQTADTVAEQARSPGRNDSGPLAAGRTALRFLRPPPEQDARLAYDQVPPEVKGSMVMFRHTGDLSRLPATVNRKGLGSLRLSGSERIMSETQVQQIKDAMGPRPLVVADLRLESHAVAAGYPLTWRGPASWVNVGLRHEEAVQREARWVEQLNGRVSLTLEHSEHVKGRDPDPRYVQLTQVKVRTEQEIVEAGGAQYRRLSVIDHLRPDRDNVDRFIDLVRSLPADAALHVHCNGGMGRTTTFMAMYDMLRNARDVEVGDILERQSMLGYDYPLTDFSRSNHPQRLPYKQDRLAFLREFHTYARENPDGLPLKWSQWRSGVTGP